MARRFVTANLADLPPDRYAQAVDSLQLQVTLDRQDSGLSVQAEADLGGFLFSSMLPLLSGVMPVSSVGVSSGAQQALAPTQVVLAIDTSRSMSKDFNGNDPRPGESSKGDLTKERGPGVGRFSESQRAQSSRDRRCAVGCARQTRQWRPAGLERRGLGGIPAIPPIRSRIHVQSNQQLQRHRRSK